MVMNKFIDNCQQVVIRSLLFPMAAFTSTTARIQYISEVFNSLNIVWFSKTLKNHKALVMSTHEDYDHIYWEVTFNGETNEYYVDEYHKKSNTVITPSED